MTLGKLGKAFRFVLSWFSSSYFPVLCVCIALCLQVDMGRLLQWVGQAGWCWREGVRVRAQCPCGHPADQALALLQAQLQVLRAARRHSSVKYHPALSLEHWSMTRAVMQALQGLPQWPCAVHISTSQWPLEPNEYRSLAQYIPTGCVCVRVCVCVCVLDCLSFAFA